jgi:alcohol dehydrogenase class IV
MLIIKKGSAKNLNKLINVYGANSIFLVCGKTSHKTKFIKEAIDRLSKFYTISLFNKFSSNPKYVDAVRGSLQFTRSNAQIIIAIGGGSVIDMAKLINAFQCHKKKDFKEIVYGKIKANKKTKPMIVLPTTAGSGSEATHFAVIYLNNKKFSVSSKYLLPDISLIDQNLAISMSSYTIACSGFDALSQAIESYWSIGSNEKSRKFSKESIQIILINIKKAINKNHSALKNMMIAANLAGKAINITKTTAPHALSYAITSLTGLPHGHAVAITLGKFFKINYLSDKINPKQNKRTVLLRMNNLYNIFGVKNYTEAEYKWYKLMRSCGLENNFKKNNLSHYKTINFITSSINLERLANHPVKLSNKDLKNIFK